MPVARRSTSIKVLAALNLVGGFLGLLGALMGVVGLLMGNAAGGLGAPGAGGPAAGAPGSPTFTQADVEAYMATAVPGYRAYQVGAIGISLLLNTLLVVSGFGLLKFAKWGRTSAITWGWLNILTRLGSAVFTSLFVIPAMSGFLDTALPAMPPAQAGIFRTTMVGVFYFAVAIELVLIVYPIVLLSILLSKSGKAAFEPLPLREADDYDDEDDYDDRRERFRDRDRPRPDDERFGERDDRGGRY